MKLLFDHNLSHKLVRRLEGAFPESTQIRLLDLGTADDSIIWEYARQHGFIVVTLDADFHDLVILRGHPPKLIWLRCGNSRIADIERRLRDNLDLIGAFAADETAACLDVY